MLVCIIVVTALALTDSAFANRSKQIRVNNIMNAINKALVSRGHPYSNYSCKTVSWDDGDRGTVNGELSVWGASITDTRLWEKHGTQLFTVRTDNWNEKLGKVKASEISLVIGNHIHNGKLEGITLANFLKNAGTYGSYAGMNSDTSLQDLDMDDEVSIRFQTTFLPVSNQKNASIEFAPEAYNYNTLSDDDPKNIVVLATTQGIAVQQDGKGAKKLFHHVVAQNGIINRHWLEAEKTKHRVGGSQIETDQERKNAEKRGKATSKLIGIPSMGERFNVLMTIQVPLNLTKTALSPGIEYGVLPLDSEAGPGYYLEGVESFGQSNAARVSAGSKFDTWDGLGIKIPQRHQEQHVTVTVVFYNTVAGGVPKPDDVIAAIDDMERLYKACDWTGNLADKKAGFMKSKLTNETMAKIWNKVTKQPYKPDV